MDEVEMSFRYVPGPHLALVRPGLVVLVEPAVGAPRAVRLHEALSALGPEEGMAVVLDAVTSVLDPTWRALPSFVVVVVRDGDVHVAARGSLGVTVQTDDREQVVAGHDVTTWVEKRVRDVRELTVRGTDGTSGDAEDGRADGAGDDGALPVTDAVVPVRVLTWAAQRPVVDDEPLGVGATGIEEPEVEQPEVLDAEVTRGDEHQVEVPPVDEHQVEMASVDEPHAEVPPVEEPDGEVPPVEEPDGEVPPVEEPDGEVPPVEVSHAGVVPEELPEVEVSREDAIDAPAGDGAAVDLSEARASDGDGQEQPLTRAALRSVSLPDPADAPELDELQRAELEFGRTLAAYPDEWRTTTEEDVEDDEPAADDHEPGSGLTPEPEPEPTRESVPETAPDPEPDVDAASAVPSADAALEEDDELDDSTVFSPGAASVVTPAPVAAPSPAPYGAGRSLPPVPPPPPPPPAAPSVAPAPTGATPVVGYGISPATASYPGAASYPAVPSHPTGAPLGGPSAPPPPHPFAPPAPAAPGGATSTGQGPVLTSGQHGVPAPSPAPAPAQDAPQDEPRPVGPQILARSCYFGHANPPVRMTCATCGGGLSPNAQLVERPALGRVSFSHGEVVELVRPVVVGRFPQPQSSGPDAPRLVTVVSPSQDVSRSHLEIRLEGWHVLVVDLDTVNGTTLRREGQPPRRLHPHEETLVASGDVVDLGDGVLLTFEGMA